MSDFLLSSRFPFFALLVLLLQFNSVLRLLTIADMHEEVQFVFHMMSGGRFGASPSAGFNTTTTGSINSSSITGTHHLHLSHHHRHHTSRGQPWNIRPSTFTIAELVRSARASGSITAPAIVCEVVQWALSEGTLIPMGVMNDAVSFLYG